MQTILGSGGAIGTELAKALPAYTKKIRLVSRNPHKVNETDELFKADLVNFDEVIKAVKKSEVVYLTAGLKYSYKVWKQNWPVIMENVINACRAAGARLVFFDNIYMYDGNDLDPITEVHRLNPPSKKGQVRARISQMILDAIEHEEINALIARSADFYGPAVKDVSMLTEMVINPLYQGKKVRWLGGLNFKHSFTFTPDAGKATALLGNTPDAFGEVWHLPTAADPPTMQEWIDLISKKFGKETKPQVISKFMLKSLGIFVPIMKEITEMAYQYDKDYVFSSEKFEKRFTQNPTPYREGIDEIIRMDYS